MISKSELKKTLNELFGSQRLAVLATQSEGYPYGNLVAFAATADLRSFLFATTRATRKYNYISADPRVSLVIDNRSNEVADFGEAMAVTVQGRAEEVGERERKPLQEFFLTKHPYLREFVSAPTCALMQVRVEKYILVHRFQNVMELAIE
jgi:nitroimidazol reductase NimA-like FMN-containing flavoprotein (pyridoxamine 5'-phosphate oxidase superfamily)